MVSVLGGVLVATLLASAEGVPDGGSPDACVPDAGPVSLAALDGGTLDEAALTWPLRIDGLELEGLEYSRPVVVERELPWRVGELVSRDAWALGTARVWNTDLFSHVRPRLLRRGEATVASYDLDEHFWLNPLGSFGVGGGRWWGRLALTDINFLGRGLEWSVRYERFDVYNGGQAWLKDPYLFGRRLLGKVEVDFLFRPRPQYARRRLGVSLELSGELDDQTRLGGHLEAFRDTYLPPVGGSDALPPTLDAVSAFAFLKRGRVDLVRLRQRGWTVELRGTGYAVSNGPAPLVAQGLAEVLAFALLGDRFNLAWRGQAGLSSPAPVELAYYLGGLDQVRGTIDSSVHTHRYLLSNLELRATLFDSTWFALMAVAFTDAALADDGGARAMLTAGGGVRLLIPKLAHTGVRGDVGVTLLGPTQVGFCFGVYQFF